MIEIKLPFVNPKSLGEMIRQQIRTALYCNREATKVEIAQMTGLTFPTISKAVEEMRKGGEVLLAGVGESGGGRRPQIYRLNPDYRYGLAVYLEKNITKYTVLNYVGDVVAAESREGVLQDGPAALDKQIARLVGLYPPIYALTFGVPGAVKEGKLFHIPGYERFEGYDLRAAYRNNYSLIVQVENDMNATVLGYHDRLDNDEHVSLVYLYFGMNGPGAGIIVNGSLVRGKSDFAGEIACMPLYDSGTFSGSIRAHAHEEAGAPWRPEVTDGISRLVAALTTVLNPDFFVFCSLNVTDDDLIEITRQCAAYVPEQHLPALIISDWEEDYMHGLKQLTIRNMLGTGEN